MAVRSSSPGGGTRKRVATANWYMTPATIQTWQNGATGTVTVIELGILPMPATIAEDCSE